MIIKSNKSNFFNNESIPDHKSNENNFLNNDDE
jgi:hypothetical protein